MFWIMSRFLYVALMLFIQANNTIYYVIDSQILCIRNYNMYSKYKPTQLC